MPIIIPVMLNLCLDYGKPHTSELAMDTDSEEEKAQQNCMEHRLDLELFEVISSDRFTKFEGYQALVCHICKLLEMLLLWRTLVRILHRILANYEQPQKDTGHQMIL